MNEHWLLIIILAALLRTSYVSWNVFFYLVHAILLHAFNTESVSTSFHLEDFSNTQIFHANSTVEWLRLKLGRPLFEIGRVKGRYWIRLYFIFILVARVWIIVALVYLFDYLPVVILGVVIAFMCAGGGILANFWWYCIFIFILDLVFIFHNQWLKRSIFKLLLLHVTNEIALLIKL